MKVTLSYFGQLRQKAGVESDQLESAEGATLDELLAGRAQQYGEEFGKIVLDESGRLRASVIALLNGAGVDRTAPTTLADGDEVTLIPPIAGG